MMQLIVLLAITSTVVEAADEKAILMGVVHAEKDIPIAGAKVQIWTAGPRKGAGDLCPSCYPDCGKHTVTDGQGKFMLPVLDPRLVYSLAVSAKGHVARITERIDPKKGAFKVMLRSHDLDRCDPSMIVIGCVLDADGRPVSDAIIETTGAIRGGVTYGGSIREADSLAITDERGQFRIGLTKKIDALYVTVRAPFLAPRQSGRLTAGSTPNEIKLVRGATVQGVVVSGGKFLAGVTLRLTQNMVMDAERKRDRSSHNLTFEIDTDSQGNFSFDNLPPDEDYVLVGVITLACKLLTKAMSPLLFARQR